MCELDEEPSDRVPTSINKETALGICLIGNLGFYSLRSKVPSVGFTDISEMSSGIPYLLKE